MTTDRTPISPEQIAGKQFVVNLRGYDKIEVDAFLREVAADYRTALALANAAVEPAVDRAVSRAVSSVLETAPAPHDPVEDLSAEVAQVLDAARRSAVEITARAQEQADEMLADARRRSADLGRGALDEVRRQVRQLVACERIARARLAALGEVIDEALARPALADVAMPELGIVDVTDKAEAERDAEIIDLRQITAEFSEGS